MPLIWFAALAAANTAHGRCPAIDHGGFVKSQMLECATMEMDRADHMLNVAYAAAIGRLASSERRRLRDQECLWIGLRRDRCRAASHDPIPSPEINRMRCLVRETDKRTASLRAIR